MTQTTTQPRETRPDADPKTGKLKESHVRALPGQPWAGRKEALLDLFENIEPRYDRLNRILSLGIDQYWRRWAVRSIETSATGPWLDLASGTGDLAEKAARRLRQESSDRQSPNRQSPDRQSSGPQSPDRRLVRSDLSGYLLAVGREKLKKRGLLSPGAAAEMDRLPLSSNTFSAVLQGFALRHCEDYGGFFRELHRVLQSGGQLAILDMRYPREGLGAGLYRFYFGKVLPRLAGWLGADRSAYEFMVDSVVALPQEEVLLQSLRDAGFSEVESRRGLFGAVHLLLARK